MEMVCCWCPLGRSHGKVSYSKSEKYIPTFGCWFVKISQSKEHNFGQFIPLLRKAIKVKRLLVKVKWSGESKVTSWWRWCRCRLSVARVSTYFKIKIKDFQLKNRLDLPQEAFDWMNWTKNLSFGSLSVLMLATPQFQICWPKIY